MRDRRYSISFWRKRGTAWFQCVSRNSTIAAVSAEGFLTRLGFSMVGFALPLYALSLGMSLAEVTFLYALRTATVFMIKPVMGWVADHCGRKSTLVGAVILRCLMGLLFVFAFRPWHLYVLRVLHGAMTAARDPSAAALIAEHGDKKSMASAYAWYSTARDFGRSLGFAVAGLLIQYSGNYRVVFFVSFLTSCAALATVIRYVKESKESVAEPLPTDMTDLSNTNISYRSLLPYAWFALLISISAEMMLGLFPIIATQYAHLTEGQAGVAASMSTVAILIAGPLFGWLSDHVDRKIVLGARSFANTVSSLLYILFPSFNGFVVARVIDDTGKAAFKPTWGAILATVSDSHPAHRARTMTLLDSAYTLGEIIAPLMAGFLLSGYGIVAMLSVRAALAVVAEIQTAQLFKSSQPNPVSEWQGDIDQDGLPRQARTVQL
jgi:MFS family permease